MAVHADHPTNRRNGEPEDRRRAPSRRRPIGRRITDLAKHPDAWVTVDAVAEYYGVSVKTVLRKWRAQSAEDLQNGLLEVHEFPQRNTRVRVCSLLRFEARYGVTPTST